MSDYECTIDIDPTDWQRSNATKFRKLVERQKAWMQTYHVDFWNDWVVNVFNLNTADEFGLSVWAIILNEAVYGTQDASGSDYDAWGYGENRKNYGNGNYGTNNGTGYNFTVDEARILLLMKAYCMHMSGFISAGDNDEYGFLSVNPAMKRIWGEGNCVCYDNRDMTLTYYVSTDYMTLAQQVLDRDLFPCPSGMSINDLENISTLDL